MFGDPARHAPIAQGNVELIEPLGISPEIIGPWGAGLDWSVPLLGLLLFRDGQLEKVP
jgi:hypothetical protein